MRTNDVLIDYENIQPKNLSLLVGDHFRIKVFVGQSQQSLPYALATAMQALSSRACRRAISS